jgi:hypothetical protein
VSSTEANTMLSATLQELRRRGTTDIVTHERMEDRRLRHRVSQQRLAMSCRMKGERKTPA